MNDFLKNLHNMVNGIGSRPTLETAIEARLNVLRNRIVNDALSEEERQDAVDELVLSQKLLAKAQDVMSEK